MNNEQWVDIPNYPQYQISNYGRVKSLKWNKERMLKPLYNKRGYQMVRIYEDRKYKFITVHQLVMLGFKGIEPNGRKHSIDHIDGDKDNNRLDNLEIVSYRENMTRYYTSIKTSSKYTGVCYRKETNKFKSSFVLNKKQYHLGYSVDEYECHLWYQNVLEYFTTYGEEKTIEYIHSKKYKIT